eukprot:675987-Rhodomonas_salina.3
MTNQRWFLYTHIGYTNIEEFSWTRKHIKNAPGPFTRIQDAGSNADPSDAIGADVLSTPIQELDGGNLVKDEREDVVELVEVDVGDAMDFVGCNVASTSVSSWLR